jgi:hypothetical protein
VKQEDRDFLERLACGSELRLADRKEDRARQRCRKKGYAAYKNARWRITAKGQRALCDAAVGLQHR